MPRRPACVVRFVEHHAKVRKATKTGSESRERAIEKLEDCPWRGPHSWSELRPSRIEDESSFPMVVQCFVPVVHAELNHV